jgi:hypothetical protein
LGLAVVGVLAALYRRSLMLTLRIPKGGRI